MIAEIIRDKRLEMGYSQNHLAMRIGVTQKDISTWENGHTKPGSHNLIKLGLALDLEFSDLKEEVE